MSEEKIKFQNGEKEMVPYAAIEVVSMFAEKDKKRLWIVILILIASLIISNALWIYHESQYEDVSITQEVQQDTESGDNSFVGGDFNGETESKNDNKSSGKEKRQD